jgi:hypothetical protein
VSRLRFPKDEPVQKNPNHPGLINGMTLDMGLISPGESAVYSFTMTLDGRRYWNASQRARAVFHLEFQATQVPPGATPTPSPEAPFPKLPTPSPIQLISPTPSIATPAIPTPGNPASASADSSLTPTSAPDASTEEPEVDLKEELPDDGVRLPTESIILKPSRAPKTGDSRMRIHLLLIDLALISAYFMLRRKKAKNGNVKP